MGRLKRFIVSFLCLAPIWTQAQPNSLIRQFRAHISILASDSLEGRDTGSEGARKAEAYIIQQFESIGLVPKGEEGYVQRFDFLAGKNYGNANELILDGRRYTLKDEYFALARSGNGRAEGEMVDVGYGIVAPELDHDDYNGLGDLSGKVFVMRMSSPDGLSPHSKFHRYLPLAERLALAIEKGATGVVIVREDAEANDPEPMFTRRIAPMKVPVIFLRNSRARDLEGLQVRISVQLEEDRREGHNLAGYIDNGADHTIIYGAHYDHLGYGGEGSLWRGEKAIHNGADDNASGVALLLELARKLKAEEDARHNYLILAFSGEEKGLLGSNYYCKNPTLDFKTVSHMINFDMVGRVDPDKHSIGINGTGTSPTWEEAFNQIETGLKIKTSESGTGPSDHTSFYLQNLPVLHFFSGTHGDYHKPSDDADRINYEGMLEVYSFVSDLHDWLTQKEKLEFTATTNEDNESVPRFTVTLGVVPDYLFEGEGMRIDGVSPDKPAEKAKLKTGDVVIGLGDYPVTGMMSYMKALSQFKKGDKTTVKVMRGKKQLKRKIQF